MNTLDPYVDAYLRDRVRLGRINHATARDFSYTLRGFSRVHGNRTLAQLGPATVDDWLGSIRDRSPATRRNYLSRVRDFCRWLVRKRKVHRDPTAEVETISQPRSIERAMRPDEVAALLDVLPDNRARAIVWLEVGCGLRCVEVSRLGVSDYDQRDQFLKVIGKGGHRREVPVPAEVATALAAYMAETGGRPGPLIRSFDKPWAGISAKTISTYMRKWCYEAGVKHRPYDGVGAHALRHTAASDVLDNCDDLRVIQGMLGHANIATTSRYLRRASLAKMREAMEGRDYRSPPAAA